MRQAHRQTVGLAFCIVAFAASAVAQNTYPWPASGNVGIGTTAPSNTLHVVSSQSQMVQFQNTEGQPARVVLNGDTNTAGYAGDLIYQYNGTSVFGIYTTGGATADLGFYPNDAGTAALVIKNGGNVGIGTTAPGASLEVNGNVKLTANSGSSITFSDGTVQSSAYTGVTCGGDYAESVDVTGDHKRYEPGDVLVVDPNAPGRFLKANEPYSTLVSGIYSTKPGTVGRRQLTPKSPDELPMAMMGIVPTKVTAENGPIKTGDLLVASSSPGRAMRGTDRDRLTGAVLGKALGNLNSGTGVIEVLVTLQ